MNRYRHYNTYVLGILAIVFAIVGSFDYLINPYVSNLILKRIFNYKVESIPQDFGIYLTKENLNNQMFTLKQKRYFWLQKN